MNDGDAFIYAYLLDGKGGGKSYRLAQNRQLGYQSGPALDTSGFENTLPPKARFSIWYFLIAILLFTYLQQYFLSAKVETIQHVRKILSERRTVLDDLAQLLSQKESVQGDELRMMLSDSAPGMTTSWKAFYKFFRQ